ncbi:MAG: radical SAM protein [Chloroflexi bacterium]|nr:radical SAM protein [Chloroflexota bacterium]
MRSKPVRQLFLERAIAVTDRPGIDAKTRVVYDAKTSPVSRRDFLRVLTGESVRTAVRAFANENEATPSNNPLPRERDRLVNALKQLAPLDQNALAAFAGAIRLTADAGLNRVNISLDSLRREQFAQIVGVDAFDAVWAGILAAAHAGLAPLKINVVAMRGINDAEFESLARLTLERDWHVRFIELMPVGAGDAAREFFAKHFIAANELIARLPALMLGDSPRGNGPARTYRLPNARGTVGFITPASEHFCNACNRIRVTASGSLCACLFGDRGVDMRRALCAGVSEAALQELLARAIGSKPEHHPFGTDFKIEAGAMSLIGG